MSENIVSSVEAPYDVAGPEAPAGTAADAAKTDKELPAGAGDAPVAEGGDAAAAKADDAPADGTDATADGTDATADEQEVLERIAKAPKEDVAAALKDNGLDFTKFEREYIANGDLSESSYKELEKAGITKKHVEAYLRGNEALMQQTITEITDMAGGMEGYRSVIQWAADNLPEEEITAYNEAMNSGNKPLIKMAVSGLVSRYRASEGSEPELVKGRAPAANSGAGAGFASKEEMVAAMRDPRYGKDSAYTREVERKTGASTFFGY